jgi:arylformamidase
VAVWQDYDQAALDAQYNNGARVPNAPEYAQKWAAQSAEARSALSPELGVTYDDHARQIMDIFAAPGAGAPTLVFIHGGYWQRMDISHYSYPAPAINAAGINYIALEYRLAPEVGIGDIVDDVRNGLAWINRNGADHGIDPARLYVAGHSAGGHLTAMAMETDWPALGAELPSDLVKGGCAISGLYDLEPIRLSFLNEVLNIAPDDVAGLSPASHPASRLLHVAVGGDESPEFVRQTSDFYDVWTSAGGTGAELVLPGDNHFSIGDRLTEPEGELFKLIADMCFGR